MNWEPRLIVALAFLIVAFAAPQGEKELIDFVSSIHEMNADGSYSFDFESEDGTKVSESGSQNQVGPQPEDIGTVSRGSYSYTSPDGVVITVNWIADENGFQATGDHLPTPPPMPEHRLLRLLTSGANNVGRKAPPKGSYSYISPEGVTLTVNWVAKANGIQDTGNRLPTPRMPQQRLLRLLAGANNAGLLAAPKGSYSFTTPDGVVLTVNWVADENGFQATGDHLPTPPPMPEHRLLRLLTSSANNAGLLAAPKGSYSFTTPDGVVLTVNWVADENGFQATGDHLLTPPPMPEHVVRMLADLKAARLL